MPDPKFSKPSHGIPRDTIKWYPTVNADACIGCGTCVTGCSRMVYRYDYDFRKAVVVDPLNCMVGCTTCANTCPTHAIHFPSLSAVFSGRLADVISKNSKGFQEADAYVAGPPVMMPGIMKTLVDKGIVSDNINVDSFGL